MFLENTRKIIKKLHKDSHVFVAYASSQKECSELSIGQFNDNCEIIAKGLSKDVDDSFCKIILPEPVFINNLLTSSVGDSYKCYCCENLKLDQYIAHVTAMSSWDCLLHSMGNPKYIIITQETA